MLFICSTEFTPEEATNVFNSIYQANVVHNVLVKGNKMYLWILDRIDIDPKIYARYGVNVYNIQQTTCRASF